MRGIAKVVPGRKKRVRRLRVGDGEKIDRLVAQLLSRVATTAVRVGTAEFVLVRKYDLWSAAGLLLEFGRRAPKRTGKRAIERLPGWDGLAPLIKQLGGPR